MISVLVLSSDELYMNSEIADVQFRIADQFVDSDPVKILRSLLWDGFNESFNSG